MTLRLCNLRGLARLDCIPTSVHGNEKNAEESRLFLKAVAALFGILSSFFQQFNDFLQLGVFSLQMANLFVSFSKEQMGFFKFVCTFSFT